MKQNPIYVTYADYIKRAIYENYDPNPYKFIENVMHEMDFNYKLTEMAEIIFFFAINSIRVEIKITDYKDFDYDKILCRVLDYSNMWKGNKWSDKYILYSDIKKDNKHFLRKDIKNFLELN